ncbi:LysR substrate-binding domain-containing protein [Pseudomonas bohemica]|uniref:LysR substrate-binding domain-containing protein n=1 Tax=Pseudomonas bohemica TaxID=2044872 RepID=UPI000DA63087|nr:LysR substrate-binding domain-containing protein [Pseudomonas bohemica]
MKRLPPLPALHTFLITARCCNFTRAAQLLHITQGAVSRQISGLESHLGYRLFHRQARGLSLTAQGREFFPRIEHVFGLIEEAVDHLETGQQTLQLKAPTCITRWLLPRLLQWQKERPDVPVELTTTIAHDVDFRRERFDAAVVYGGYPDDSPHVHHLFDEQLTPVCAPSLLAGAQPLERFEDLDQHMLLHPTLDEQDWAHWLKAAGTRLGNVGKGQHFDTMDLAMTVASQGSGIAMGDWSLIGEDLRAGRLITPFDLRVKTGAGYYFVYPTRTESTPQLRELLDWLLAEAAARNR